MYTYLMEKGINMNFRIGQGYDVHKLVIGRKLVIGGVEIPSQKGLLGHSDADVLTHAIIDAVLGAAGLGDIGESFPDTNPLYKDVSSLQILWEVGKTIYKSGWQVQNIDATVVAESPKMSAMRRAMEGNIATTLGVSADAVNVKYTTEEGMGFTGKEEGISAQAICLLVERGIR
jgi:2-C-methyl-D-erythritol 2,4-cyclodiphosphate synthase